FLFTGDMERPIETQLVGDNANLRADVLKVGHHGSNTSSSELFLNAVSPAVAVISDGYENAFHHPHPQVNARLGERQAQILGTDRLGLITVRTDGIHLTVETFDGRAASHGLYPPSTPGLF